MIQYAKDSDAIQIIDNGLQENSLYIYTRMKIDSSLSVAILSKHRRKNISFDRDRAKGYLPFFCNLYLKLASSENATYCTRKVHESSLRFSLQNTSACIHTGALQYAFLRHLNTEDGFLFYNRVRARARARAMLRLRSFVPNERVTRRGKSLQRC